jgi:hypothetical protein
VRRVGKWIVAVVAVEGAREGEGIIVVAMKGAQLGEGIIIIAEKGVRVGDGIANVITAAAAARVKDSRPSPYVGLPAAPLSSMIATPVTARPSPHMMRLPAAPLSVLVASLTLVTTPPSLYQQSIESIGGTWIFLFKQCIWFGFKCE